MSYHDEDEPFCTLAEAQRILKANDRTVRKWLETGLLQGFKRPDGRILIIKETIFDCLKTLQGTS